MSTYEVGGHLETLVLLPFFLGHVTELVHGERVRVLLVGVEAHDEVEVLLEQLEAFEELGCLIRLLVAVCELGKQTLVLLLREFGVCCVDDGAKEKPQQQTGQRCFANHFLDYRENDEG